MESLIISTFAWINESWLRLACITLSLVFISDVIIRKVIKQIEFRRKVDQLPGPKVANALLGNIPLSVLRLFTSNSYKQADEFYTAQVQSLLGHTFIYKKEQLYRLWIGQNPVVCVWKPEIVEAVLGDNFLLEKSYHYDFLRPWLGNGLLTSPGKIWRPRRKMLVPSFHFNILQAFVSVFDRQSKLLVRNIERKIRQSIKEEHQSSSPEHPDLRCKSTVVDITPVITSCTLDAICETIMGVSINAQSNPDNDYCQSIYVAGETFLERIIQPRYWLDFVFRHTELGKLYKYHLDKLHSFTRTVIAEKKKLLIGGSQTTTTNFNQPNKSSLQANLKVLERSSVDSYKESREGVPELPKAFLDLLLDRVRTATGNQKLSDEDIREEVDTFMFEGHDTTAMALSWTLFLLGHNEVAQQKLRLEVDSFFDYLPERDSSELELDQLKQLKYLDCVIKEALRLCPSVPFIGRQTTSEFKLGDHTIPPNCVIFVLIYQLHRNPEVFPDPERFDPDRFLPENTVGRHPYAYVPFSAGPRNCIGQKFAMAEMKTILSHLIRSYEFKSITPIDKARVQMEMVLRPKCPLRIRITPRFALGSNNTR